MKLKTMNKLYFRIIIAGLVNLFFISANHAQNFVTTYAGTGSPGFVNGDTSIASFNKPFGICIDQEGNLYLADAYNNCIRKISTDGMVSTYAGNGIAGYLDGPATEAKFNQPINICLDEAGNMYVSDFLNQRIRKISSDMMVTTIAGSGIAGLFDGPSDQAKFNYPRGICLDDTGNIYIGDSWNHRVRKISLNGIVSTWAGGGTTIGVQSVGDYVDAGDTAARFYTPCELSIDLSNNIFVADAYNHRIRKIDPAGMVTTVAGSGESGPNAGGFQDGPAEQAMFKVPTACYMSLTGSIYVGDGQNQRVRKISTDGIVSTFAGSGDTGFENGPDSLATFDFPRGCVMDYQAHRLYVVDYNNHAIRIIHLTDITGLFDNDFEDKFDIFPNPSGNKIQISGIIEQSDLTLRIFNACGQMVKELSGLKELPALLNISDLETGIYFVGLFNNKFTIGIEKLVVMHK
jgi:sugar lactone lactonase YvrE